MASQTSLPLLQTLASEMTLFELDDSLCLLMESAADSAAENNGEILPELRQALLDYCDAFGTKVDNIANYIKSQENIARNAKIEIDRLQARMTAAENKLDRLKGLVKYFLESRGLRAMKGRLNTISLRKNSQDSLVLYRVDNIPADYWRLPVTLANSDIQELLQLLPAGHSLRERLLPAGHGLTKRELDNAKLRAALACGTKIDGADLRRGTHIRIT